MKARKPQSADAAMSDTPTKRELFAALILCGLFADQSRSTTLKVQFTKAGLPFEEHGEQVVKALSRTAVKAADALLSELQASQQ